MGGTKSEFQHMSELKFLGSFSQLHMYYHLLNSVHAQDFKPVRHKGQHVLEVCLRTTHLADLLDNLKLGSHGELVTVNV